MGVFAKSSKQRRMEMHEFNSLGNTEKDMREDLLGLQKEQLSVNKEIRAQAESVVSTQQKLNNLMDELNEKSTEQLIKKSTELLNLEDRLSILRAQSSSELEAQVKAVELAGEKRVRARACGSSASLAKSKRAGLLF